MKMIKYHNRLTYRSSGSVFLRYATKTRPLTSTLANYHIFWDWDNSMYEQRKIYFVRHGENPANIRRELSYKIIDYPLTLKGRWQALRTAEFLKTKNIDAIYSSPLKRAEETARIIAEALNRNIILLDEFIELDVGLLENDPSSNESWKLHDEILENWKSGNQSRKFPGGENFPSVVSRIRAGVQKILHETNAINNVVITHGGLVNSSIASVCHIPTNVELPNFENCSIIALVFNQQIHQEYLLEWAYSRHLHDYPKII